MVLQERIPKYFTNIQLIFHRLHPKPYSIMRLVLLLLMGILPELASPQAPRRVNIQNAHPYDTLQKYSYLLVSLRRDSLHHVDGPVSIGTGFFIRKRGKLYLISAKHFFTNCDPYTRKPRVDTPVAILVWYRDIYKKIVCKRLQLPLSIIRDSCISAASRPDLDSFNVSEYFKNGEINSVEHLIPDYVKDGRLLHGDTVIVYGYPNEPHDFAEFIERPILTPTPSIAYRTDIAADPNPAVTAQLPTLYYAIEPGLKPGVSGAPVFKISRRQMGKLVVQFSGVQSSTLPDGKVSLIVQGLLLSTYLLKE